MSLISYLFLGLVLLILPWISFQTKEIIDEDIPLPSKRDMYLQSIIMLSVIGALAGLVNWRERLNIQWVGPMSGKVLVYAIALFLLSMAVNLIQYKYFSKGVKEEEDFLMPNNKTEYLLWLMLCFTAAWSEEFTYRGVLTALMDKAGMLPLLSIILSAVCFSFSHFTQGWMAIPITFVFALGFQYLFKVSGLLLIPVIVHFIYNISVEWMRRKSIKKVG